MTNFKKMLGYAVLALACNGAFADIASDFNDPNISIDTLVSNALNQETPVSSADIITQLQAAGADVNAIESATASLISSAVSCTKKPVVDASVPCQKLSPELAVAVLNSSYAALAKSGADKAAYNQLTKTVYSSIPVSATETIAAIDEAASKNSNVDLALAKLELPDLSGKEVRAQSIGSNNPESVSPN